MKNILILLTIGIILAAGVTITQTDAYKGKGVYLSETNSDKVCGDKLCSEISDDTITKLEEITEEIIKDKEEVLLSLLFVQTAHSGTFIEKDGRQILTLAEISPTTVWFSDRPQRITGHEATELFVAKWGEGDDSFLDDPPNAALDLLDGTEESDVFIIELTNPNYDPDAQILQYDVSILEAGTQGLTHYSKDADATIPQTFGAAALFIDMYVPSDGSVPYKWQNGKCMERDPATGAWQSSWDTDVCTNMIGPAP